MSQTNDVLDAVRQEGFEVMNWRPGSRRIYKIINAKGMLDSDGMYSNELKAWFNGYCAAIIKIKSETG